MPDNQLKADDRLTLVQAAAICGVNERTVRRWVISSELKSGKDVKGRYRIAQADLQDFIQRKTQS